jgi:L-histidine N-alpha-methyltransferase
VLEAAYDDSAGVTAEFNRNLLIVLNRELGANFDPADFDHVAFFDPHHEWVEMRLRARRAHTIAIPRLHLEVRFAAREELRTEISAKFTPQRLVADLAAAGLALDQLYTDRDGLFALSLVRRVGQ